MKNILSYWQWDSFAVLILLLIAVAFAYGKGWKKKTALLSFGIALLILTICFFSPLHVLSAHYLFSAHMAVHVLLLLLAGPFIMISLYANDAKKLSFFFKAAARHPLLCWTTGVGIMWVWHIPVVFNGAMQWQHHSSGFNWIELIETSSLLIGGVLFSLPVLSADKTERLPALSGIVYLFTACVGCSVLGLLITFAPTELFHHYLAMQDPYGLNTIIQQQWHITKSTDQQIAGLIMWVPCCFVYVVGCLYLLMQWFGEKETAISASAPQTM